MSTRKFLHYEFCNINSLSMVIFVVIIFGIYASCDAAEEIVAYESINKDARLISDAVKRVGDSGFNDVLVGPVESSGRNSHSLQPAYRDEQETNCEPVVQQGRIIKATESVSAGAYYIDSFKNVKSNADCLEYCCINSTCDVAVYQNKADRYCYLFRCDGKCVFKPLKGYAVGTFSNRLVNEHIEENLQNLNTEHPASVGGSQGREDNADAAQNFAEKRGELTPATEETAAKTSILQTEVPELFIAPHSVGLTGFCNKDGQCEDPNAVCGQDNCICKHGYYNKEGLCRQICQPSDFECFKLGTLSRGPDCVLYSQVCDSYMHCADGSDEFSCLSNVADHGRNNLTLEHGSALSSFKSNSSMSSIGADTSGEYAAEKPVSDGHHGPHQPYAAEASIDSQFVRYPLISSDLYPNMVPLQNSEVRHKTILDQNVSPGRESSMQSGQQLFPGSVYSQNPRSDQALSSDSDVNPYTNSNFSPSVALPINHKTYKTSQDVINLLETNDSEMLTNHNLVARYPLGNPQPEPSAHRDNKAILNDPAKPLDPSHNYQIGSRQISHLNVSKKKLHQFSFQESRPHLSYSEMRQYNQQTSQPIGRPAYTDQHLQPLRQASQTLDQESEFLVASTLLPENLQSRNFMQQSETADTSFLPSKKLAIPSSYLPPFKSVKSSSHQSQSISSKSDVETNQNDIKAPINQAEVSSSESQKHLSMPGLSSSHKQKWLNPSLSSLYSLDETVSQQHQPVEQKESEYFDSSQYAGDALDHLPETEMDSSSSPYEISELDGSDNDHDRSIDLPYNSQNSGYFHEPFNNHHLLSDGYDDSNDYRAPSYHDSDFQSTVGYQEEDKSNVGLYEELNTVPMPSFKEHKNMIDRNNVHGENTQGITLTSLSSRPPVFTTDLGKQIGDASVTTAAKAATQESETEALLTKESARSFITSTISTAEAPIIFLSVGLAFTLILLLLVGCRLRTMRQRLRKDKALHQNEADYLINGMYL